MKEVLSARERISKGIIELMDAMPFYADLIMRSPIKELPKMKGVPQSMAVSVDGSLWYADEFVGTLSDDELRFVLLHEAKHKAFLDLVRVGRRDVRLWNIAADLMRDWQVLREDAQYVKAVVPKGRIVADYKGDITLPVIGEFCIKERTVEQIYDELENRIKKHGGKSGSGEGATQRLEKEGCGTKIDDHRYTTEDGRKWQDLSEEERERMEEEQEDGVVQAAMKAKQRGKLPKEMELLIEMTVKGKVDWRQYLWRHIVKELPFDMSLSRPSRRFISQGIYVPGIIKESLDVVFAFDVSGSIDEDEREEFLAECISIRTLLPNVRMTLVAHDSKVTDVIEIVPEMRADELVLHGGGGTSHVPVFKWIEENRPDARVVVACTDGDTRFPQQEDVRAEVIWVSTKKEEEAYPFGQVVMLK